MRQMKKLISVLSTNVCTCMCVSIKCRIILYIHSQFVLIIHTKAVCRIKKFIQQLHFQGSHASVFPLRWMETQNLLQDVQIRSVMHFNNQLQVCSSSCRTRLTTETPNHAGTSTWYKRCSYSSHQLPACYVIRVWKRFMEVKVMTRGL